MNVKQMLKKCRWLLMVLCLVLLQYAGASVSTAKAEDYPEVIPENLTCYYGYKYLGTLENGEILQKFYDYVDELAWAFYCSDEEITNIRENIIGEEIWKDYIAVSVDIDEEFTAEEVAIIRENWSVFYDCFSNDTPIYYYMRAGYGAKMDLSPENVLEIQAVYYEDGETGEWLEEFVSAENRTTYRELIETKLHEYYDLTKDLKTDYEKELAIHRKLVSEVEYSHEDIHSLYGHSVIGAFTGTKTVCDGYAQTFQMVCNYCGIDCIWINGKAGFSSHAWNAVKLDNEWYSVDATWNDEEAILDNEQYWESSTYEMADRAYTETYLNMPISMFGLSHEAATVEQGDTELEYPEFSDNAIFWSGYVMNEKGDKTITYDQIMEACEYICQQLEAGNTRIELHAWNSYITDVQTEQGWSIELFEKAINEFVSSTGETYRLAEGFVFGGSGSIGTDGTMFTGMSILVTQEVNYSEEIQYNRYNVAGSENGILLKKYPTAGDRVYIPDVIGDEEVHAFYMWEVEAKQLIFPAGIRILRFSGDNLEQVVIPETVRDIYSFPNGQVKSAYLPKSVKFIMGNTVSVDSIYGYAGSYAETYATEQGIAFVDLTGKEFIDTVQLSGLTVPKEGENIHETLHLDMQNSEDFSVTRVVCDTTDETMVWGTEYAVNIYITATDGKAITPNTLVDINGRSASVTCVDASNAIVTYTFSLTKEINETNFPDAVFRQYVKESIDTNGDGCLALGEMVAVTDINVNAMGIESLKGIEYFLSLDRLECGQNKLTDLDIRHNTELTMLRCSDNRLHSLDVSHNPKLEQLICWDNQYLVCAADGELILDLPGFDASKASNWIDAVYDADTNTLKLDATEGDAYVSYNYDCGNEYTFMFMLLVKDHTDTDGDGACDNCRKEMEDAEGEPSDPIEAFVTRMYRVILEREPDAGSATWVNGLKDGSMTGVRVADGFVLSEEMLNKDISNEEFVKILYRAFFGREADEGGLATWKGLLDNGCKKTYVFAGFANSTEFGNLCAEAGIVQGRAMEYLADRQTGLSEQDYKVWCFVERMYTEVLGRTADEAGVRTWVGVLQDGSYTGVEVADGFLMSDEFLAKNMTDEEYVQIMYRAFFGRNADPEGLATWTNALATGWTKQRVFAGFANSNEFGVLCEQAGIVKGTATEQ